MISHRILTNRIFFAVLTIIGPALTNAGQLNPPAGPVTTTHKTLTELEPRKAITQADIPLTILEPGSYYLTENLLAVGTGLFVIEIASSDVMLDLNGFTITGSNEVVQANYGIKLTLAHNVGIGNGNITRCLVQAISGSGADECHVTDVKCHNNFGGGVFLRNGAVVTRCTAAANGNTGIWVGAGANVQDCSARSNQGTGFVLDTGCTVIRCLARLNSGVGFEADDESLIASSIASENGSIGIRVGQNSRVTGCTSIGNNLEGIIAGNACVISECNVDNNGSHAIEVSDHCTVQRNNASTTGTADSRAAIRATGSGNRIEGNHCHSSHYGIWVTGVANLIIANSVRATTTDFELAAGNRYGAIINIQAFGQPAVSGASAASVLTTTDPWANFAF